MNTKTLFSFFTLFLSIAIWAQPPLPVYSIKIDTPVNKLPDTYWQMVIDENNKWSIADIQTLPVKILFNHKNPNHKGVGYSGITTYWQRAKLKNETGKDVTLVFSNSPKSDEFEIYVFRSSGVVDTLRSGNMIPFSKRKGFKTKAAVPVILTENEEITLYKRFYNKRNSFENNLTFGFSVFDNFVEKEYLNEPWHEGDVRNWLIAGILIFGFFFNFFFFWIDRDKVYLFMALLLLVEGFWYITSGRNLIFREAPITRYYLELFISHILFFSLVTQFVRHFLKTFIHYPRWDKVILVLLALMIITFLSGTFIWRDNISFAFRGVHQFIISIFFFLLMTALLISFLYFKKEKDRLTNLSVVAAFPAFLMWSIGYLIVSIVEFVLVRNGKERGSVSFWAYNNQMILEMFCVAWFAIGFTWILLQRYAQLRKQYMQQALEREQEKTEIIQNQKIELEKQVNERTSELKKSIDELKATQAQLIQSEKMASLGELTAGIAHEIQNPLNFINNFSDVNTELIDEMEAEIQQGNMEEVKSVTVSIKENNDKIIYHGKRADSIVKNMLQHSRKNTGEKELTDINALVEEYLRLSYHGLRAKDKTFNANMKSDFDPTIGKISIVSQDMSRVLLNLFNNAFYSVNEKKKHLKSSFEPLVEVSTKKMVDSVEIEIKDNGMGIAPKVIEKIYQPFFTTKPTGEGTGLGLSMSYEIIKTGHNGELKVTSTEGEFASFIIILPI